MFHTIIKNFFIKKIVTKRLLKQQSFLGHTKIATVGILVDETFFSNTTKLIEQICLQGFKKEQISVLVYKDRIKSKEEIAQPFVSLKNFSWSGEINKPEVNDFLATPFDVLINYYDINKYPILLMSIDSKAKFKVGFESVDKRANHFIIKAGVAQYEAFTFEFVKYLKILNKI
jgi:hypothetical protein